MSLPQMYSKLQGLKRAAGRRIKEPIDLPEESPETYDVSGTANPMLPESSPQQDVNDELPSQSYDVRANTVMPSEMEQPLQEEGFWEKFGRNLALQSRLGGIPAEAAPQVPPIETQQTQIQEGLPPVSASEEEQIAPAEMAAPIAEVSSPQPAETPVEAQASPMPSEMETEIAEEEKEPGTYVEVGSIERLMNDPNASPVLKEEIERIFDTQLTPVLAKQAEEMEKVVDAYMQKLEGVDVALSKREQELLKKVESRNLSGSEQIAMALALVAPAIISGLLTGKQGFLSGLAEGGKGVGAGLAARNKEIAEAEELLPEVALERAKIGKEKMMTASESEEMKKKIRESTPNQALRQLFTKDGMILNGKLVLNTGNPLLPLKSTAVRSEKDYERFKEKTMPELRNTVSSTEQGLHLLDNLRELVEITEKKKEGGVGEYIPMWDLNAKAFKALIPAGRDTFIDENGNEVKISELYETTLEQISDMYSQAISVAGSKAAFKTYREHFKEMIPNPYTFASLAQGKTKPGTVLAQIDSVKKKFEDNILSRLDSVGVDTDPVKQLFKSNPTNVKKSEENRKKERANQAVNQVLGQ